eukprot:CAMPEP_0119414480 /NCGR_PEP_ID=MMETSP1335-20130426/7019_1 /TAXON_ID=259385 /ORGANISM="Chrysoculter rhomboideus, Strain RCC1486" /LENGTH=162 /DNA_ID=CAMNT_0007439361 /DNA_START=25 /DNA_END=513 /DNA_ORIENTATION=+
MLVSTRMVRGAPLGLRQGVSAAVIRLRPSSTASYTERQNQTGRPISPHLTIYKWPVAALSSISTRLTGVAMMVGMSGIGGLALVGADVPGLVTAFQTSFPALVPVGKVAVAFPLTYHYLSALRHTYWDFTAAGLELGSVRASSWGLFGGAAAISLGLAAVTL